MTDQKEFELSGLLKFGLTYDSIKTYDIICFPENLNNAASENELYDAADAIALSKHLKLSGIKCGNSIDIGLNAQIFERRSDDKWFGIVYLRNNLMLPVLAGVLSNILSSQLTAEPQKNEPEPKVHIELKLEKSDNVTTLKYDGDAKTLITILENLDTDSKKTK